MPRGFLVKRFSKNSPPPPLSSASPLTSGRSRRYSDEDRSDTSSDHELIDPSDVVRQFPGPPPLRSLGPRKSVDGDSQLGRYTSENCQDVPLALTTDKPLPPSPAGRSHPFRQALFFQTTPPPLKHKILPRSAPAITGPQQLQQATPRSPASCPRKRPPTDLSKAAKKSKAVRRLNFDQDKSSPVSGTFIRDLDDTDEMMLSGQHPTAVKTGDIDPSLNVVVVTEEARAELAKIENKIGDYVCQLCKEHYDDAFGLAQHRCSRIVHVEYRCPECDKVFNCPANLASHRRWHKPRPPPKSHAPKVPPPAVTADDDSPTRDLECHLCRKKFSQYFYFRKHLLSHLTTADAEGRLDSDVIQSVFSSEKRPALARLNAAPPQAAPPSFEKHDELKGLQCKYCSSVFYSSAGLTRHINKHHPSENRIVQAPPVVRPMST